MSLHSLALPGCASLDSSSGVRRSCVWTRGNGPMRSAAVLLVFLAGCTAGRAPNPASSAREDDPFAFEVDHSALLLDGTVEVAFEVSVHNRTAEAVRFGPVGCHCGCSESTRPRDQLGPGESM